MSPASRRWLPHLLVPKLPPLTALDRLALLLGTGFGTGFIRPLAPTWGSIPGFLYFAALLWLGSWEWGAAITFAGIVAGVWSAGRSERLIGTKDPKPVVVDEWACAPLALWPLAFLAERPLWLWVALFCVYRIADGLKPFPARRLEALGGGFGIMLDDVVSASYVGALFFAAVHFRWL